MQRLYNFIAVIEMELASRGIVSQFWPDILKLQFESILVSSYTV
jgi:hypothetical protein